jgi:hypothetical protein
VREDRRVSAKDTETELLKLVNDSGFPFQMSVTGRIAQSVAIHKCKLVAEEHPWKHRKSNSDGFADLILRHEIDALFRAVVECKRFKDNGKWVFLASRSALAEESRLSVFWTNVLHDQMRVYGWHDFQFTPVSPEAAFCTLFGDNNKRTTLERIADELPPATESVGLKETALSRQGPDQMATTRCYLPVIVTNALLYTASFDASDLDMKTGQLPPGKCDFREVPCVRFRKSLGLHLTTQKEVEASNRDDAIVQQNRASQRTIIVLNSASMSESMIQHEYDRVRLNEMTQRRKYSDGNPEFYMTFVSQRACILWHKD